MNVGPYDRGSGGVAVERWLGEQGDDVRSRSVEVEHTWDIETFCLYQHRPLSRALVGMWLSELVLAYGHALLRVKGLVNVAGARGPLVIHAVQSRLYPPMALKEWPSEDRRTRIVFITQGVGRAELEDSLATAIGRFPAHSPADRSGGSGS